MIQTIVGIILTIVLAFLSSRLGKILDAIDTFKDKFSSLDKIIAIYNEKVDILYAEYNKRREEEIISLRERVKEYESR
jgi:predicted RNA-binding protein Jag